MPRPAAQPYQDIEWKVHLPGARRIKVVFDPRSRTETNCDWITITQEEVAGSSTQEARRGRSARYHGRLGSENFPGFGGRRPLWLDGDRFVARFKSDPSSTDWGVRFTAYGVLGGSNGERDGLPTAAGAAVRSVLDAAPEGVAVDSTPRSSGVNGERKHAATTVGRAAALELDLSCWLLELLIRKAWWVPEVAARFCDTEAMAGLHECLKAFCQRWRMRVLRLVASVASEARLSPAFTAPSSRGRGFPAAGSCEREAIRPSGEDMRALLGTVLVLTEAQRVLEGEAAVISTYLQALVQCAVVLHAFLAILDEKPAGRVAGDDDRKPAGDAQESPSSESLKTSEVTLDGGPGAIAVRDVAMVGTVLSEFAQGTTPVRLLFEDFLPILTEACSVTVQSAHPFDRLSTRQSVIVPSAIALQALFDPRTEMGEDDRIIIRGPNQQARAADSGVSQSLRTTTAEGGLLCESSGESTFLGLAGGTIEDTLPPTSVGDLVVRGPDWTFGNEDGGEQCSMVLSGSPHPRIGVVLALERWAGRDGGGARVRWMGEGANTGFDGSEIRTSMKGGDNWAKGFQALYSVRDPTHLCVVKRGGPDRSRRPVVVAGDTLDVEAIPAAGGGSTVNASDCDEVPTPSGDENNGRSRGHCFRFDGESTYVDLPSYGGMRLQGDFTLEVWAWLDPGTARNDKPKCIISRVLDQPLLHSRRPTRTRSASAEFAAMTSLTTPAPIRRAALPSANQRITPNLLSTVNGDASVSEANNQRFPGIAGTAVVPAAVAVAEATAASAATASGQEAASSGMCAYDDSPATSVSGGVRTVHIPANVEPMPMRVPVCRTHFGSGLEGSMVSPREVPRLFSPSRMNRPEGTIHSHVHDDVDEESQGLPAGGVVWIGRENAPLIDTSVENGSGLRSAPRSRLVNRSAGSIGGACRDAEGSCLAEEEDDDDDEEEEMEDDIDDNDELSEDECEDEREKANHGEGTGIEEGASDVGGVGVEDSSIATSARAIGDVAATTAGATSGPPNSGVVTSDNGSLGLRGMRGPHWTYRQQVCGIVSQWTLVAIPVS